MAKKMFAMALILSIVFCVASLTAPGAFAAQGEQEYKVQARDNMTGNYIIARYNVRDFGAVGDGVTDDTAAFKNAVNAVNASCGILFVPAGNYLIKESLTIWNRVSIEGQWNNPESDVKAPQSVLYIDIPEGENKHFLLTGSQSSVKNLSFYYVKQKADSVKPFGYTINAAGHCNSLENLTFINAYKAINVGNVNAGSAHFVHNIYGSVLKQGILFNEDFEVTSCTNIYFSAKYWNSYDNTDLKSIRQAAKDCQPIQIYKVDDMFCYNINLDGYSKGIRIEPNPNHTDAGTPAMAYGLFFRLNGSDLDFLNDDKYMPKRLKLDTIEGLSYYSHKFAIDRYPEKENLFVVTDYGAKGNGTTDDTQAFKQALEAARSSGGGTVFVPTGRYKLTQPLTVYENCELRGEWNANYLQSPSELHFYYGKNLPNESLVTLNKNSGIDGFTFKLPEHLWSEITPYSWAVRGAGSDVWAEHLSFINLYNGIDFFTNRCDNFLVGGIWGTAVGTGLAIGGGSQNGKVEFTFFTYGTWYESINRVDNGALSTYTYANTTGYLFGNVKNLEGFSLCIFGLKYGMVFDKQGQGIPQNICIIRSLLDSPNAYRNLWLQHGNNIAFVGLSVGNSNKSGTLVRSEDSFGKARIYGVNMWGSSFNRISTKSDVVIYGEGEKDVEILKFNFNYKYNMERGGSAILIILLSVGGALIVGGAAAVFMIIRKRKLTR